jgi:nicotinamidase-related amidase
VIGTKYLATLTVGIWFGLGAQAGLAAQNVPAPNIIEQWGQAVVPAAPVLRHVKIDPGSTALLVLDMSGAQNPAKGPCNRGAKPRCIASIPGVGLLISAARQHGVYVIYSVSSAGTRADIATAIAPLGSDPVVKSGPDKFVGTDLEALLAARKIRTVIIVGTAAEGAVLDTATHAVLQKKLSVVVPVDGITSASLYPEQYVAWQFLHAPGLAGNVTLTQTDMIGF